MPSLTLLGLFLISVSVCIASPHRCTYVFYYQPVCGNNGKTYINFGHLTCEALKLPELQMVHEGECEVTTTQYPFAELDEANETIGLGTSNMTLDSMKDALAKLNITIEEMEAALAELNMTIDQLNISSSYIREQQEREGEYRPGGRYYGHRGYDRYGRPYGYGSNEMGSMSIEFGFGGRKKVSRLIMAAAIAGAVKHQMDKKHKAKYGGGYGGGFGGGFGGSGFKSGGMMGGAMMGGAMMGGGMGYPKQTFPGSSIGAPPKYGFKSSVVNPPSNYQPLPPVKPLGHSYPKQQYFNPNVGPAQPPPYSPPKNPPPYNPAYTPPKNHPSNYPKPVPTSRPKAANVPSKAGSSSGSGSSSKGSWWGNIFKGGSSKSSGGSKSGGSKSGGSRGGGRKG